MAPNLQYWSLSIGEFEFVDCECRHYLRCVLSFSFFDGALLLWLAKTLQLKVSRMSARSRLGAVVNQKQDGADHWNQVAVRAVLGAI